MKNKNHLKKLYTILGLISLLAFSTISYADHNIGDYKLVCKESIQYFNPSKPNLEEGDELTVIDCPTDSDGLSTDHGEFPSKYTGDFEVSVSDKSKHESITRHTHSYTNNSEEECYNSLGIKIDCPENGSNHTGFNTIKYKGSWIKKFEITLHEDLMNNVDTSTMDCSSFMTSGTNCNGEGTFGENENGDEVGFYISFEENPDGTGTILLEFGDSSKGWTMPIKTGINPHFDDITGIDVSDEEERTFSYSFSFETEEAEKEKWSATTTSRIYLTDAIATMSPNTEPTGADWIFQTTDGAHESEYYYWFNIGTATTIWEKEPEEQEICSELLVNHYDPVYEDVISTFAAQAVGSDGSFLDTLIDYTLTPETFEVPYGYFFYTSPSYGQFTTDVSNAEFNLEVFLHAFNANLSTLLELDFSPAPAIGAILNKNIGEISIEKELIKPIEIELDKDIKFDLDNNEKSEVKVKELPADFELSPDALDITEDFSLPWWLTGEQEVQDSESGSLIYFLGEKPGEKVIQVQADGSAGNTCLREFDVEPLCKELQVNYEGDATSALEVEAQTELIYENRLTYFEASGLTWLNDDFSGKITYSVDSGHGTFYTYKPAGKALNNTMDNVTDVQEFDASSVDVSYYDQLCEDPTFNIDIFFEPKFETGIPDYLGPVYFDEEDKFKFPEIYEWDLKVKPEIFIPDLIPTPIPEPIPLPDTLPEPIPVPDYSVIELLDEYKYIEIPDWFETGVVPKPTIEKTKTFDPKMLQNYLLALALDPDLSALDEADLFIPDSEVHGWVMGESGNIITVDPGTKVWFYAKEAGDDVIHVKANCANSETCERHFDITAFPVCESLTLNNESFEANESGTIEITTQDITGANLPSDTNITITNTSTGTLTDKDSNPVTDVVTIEQFPLTFSGGEAGELSFSIASDSDYYSASCSANIIVGEVQTCESFELTVDEFDSAEVGEINNNKVYIISGDASFSSEASETDKEITLTIDNDYGTFIDEADIGTAATEIAAIAEDSEITEEEMSSRYSITESITINSGDGQALLVIYNNETDNASALEGKLTNFADTCFEEIQYDYEEPEEEETICEDLDILEPDWNAGICSSIDYDNESECLENNETWTKNDKLLIQLDIDTDPSNKAEDLDVIWKIEESDAKWYEYNSDTEEYEEFTDTDTELRGDISIYLGNINLDEEIKITAKALEFEETCSDSLTREADEEEELEASFEKEVFKESNLSEDNDDILNIGSETDYITFALEFEAESEINEDYTLKIKDSNLNSGELEDETKNHDLEFTGMTINVTEEDGTEYSIFRSDNYDKDSSDNDYDYDEEKDYEDCDENHICITNNKIEEDFKNGKDLIFKNLNKLEKDEGKIIIKYQMDNISAEEITSFCDDAKADDGCGLIFENEGEFEITNKNDDVLLSDDDEAKVIILCPYVLTRSGGDALFYDLPTYTDVSTCSEVKNCVGVCITPEEPEEEVIVQTGTGTGTGKLDEEYLMLELPSHDICKYSNNSDNIEGYDDVLENFSSTVCELRAEVAEEWQKENIAQAIKNNLTRIARWESSNFSSLNNLNFDSNSNGIYVTNDNLTINTNPEFNKDTPAAKTFIINGKNLIINDNITYNNTDVSWTAPKTIPSVAFIVIDGNIIIEKDVEELYGIYMAVDTDESGDDGKINSTDPTSKLLTIYGSLIGDVYNLFNNRTGIGDPKKDEGSVTIRYDERILLNTPPGISELIDIQQAIVPN